MKRSALTRKTQLVRKPPKKRTRPRPCSWGRCRSATARVVLAGDERYCVAHARKVADKLVGDAVKLRDRRCVSCGATESLQYAHVHSRGMRYIQYDLDAALTLCSGCHYKYTMRPALWSVFVEENYSGLWTRLLHREMAGIRRGDSVDLAEVIRTFRQRSAA